MSFKRIEQVMIDISNMRTDIALLLNKVDANHRSLRETLDRNITYINKHEHSLYGNGGEGMTTKIDRALRTQKDLENHNTADRWMNGIIITILIGILVKLVWPS